jgi:hypothetical protein
MLAFCTGSLWPNWETAGAVRYFALLSRESTKVSQVLPQAEQCQWLTIFPLGKWVDLEGAVTIWPHVVQVSVPCAGERRP